MNQSDIALLVRQKPLHVHQVALHRRDALADLAHFLPHGADLAADRPQLLKHRVLDVGVHGVSLSGIRPDTKGIDIGRRQHMIRPVQVARELSGCRRFTAAAAIASLSTLLSAGGGSPDLVDGAPDDGGPPGSLDRVGSRLPSSRLSSIVGAQDDFGTHILAAMARAAVTVPR